MSPVASERKEGGRDGWREGEEEREKERIDKNDAIEIISAGL